MPLRDHFRSPVNDTHSWDEVHGQWPAEIVRNLLTILPTGFRAAPKVHLGSPFEVDVSTFDLDSRNPDADLEVQGGGTATLTATAPTLTVEAELSEQDEYEVRVYDIGRGRQLVAAIEIVSPANKDRADSREVFVGKVASLLQQGVCVSIVDPVSIRTANLYAELMTLLGRSDPALLPTPPHLYAVTLRTRKIRKRPSLLDVWFSPMNIGQPLPTLPIWLTPQQSVMLPLESGYEETCRILGIA
jgi:Protein of unknown function (DUF4058)